MVTPVPGPPRGVDELIDESWRPAAKVVLVGGCESALGQPPYQVKRTPTLSAWLSVPPPTSPS
jgi:hypothetical protein